MILALLVATACLSPDAEAGISQPKKDGKKTKEKPEKAAREEPVPVHPAGFFAHTVADLVDHLEILERARPGKELREVVDAIVDAKKPASAGGKDITREEWARISRELADLGISVALVFLAEIV